MLDIKVQMRTIDSHIANIENNLSNFEIDYCFLQFRKIIEQICFAAIICDKNRYKDFRTLEGETDDKDSGDYTKDWNAQIILKKLNDINPYFMPRPLGKKTSFENKHHFDIKDINATHNKLIKMYKTCNYYMHMPKPFGTNYKNHILNKNNRYKSSINTIKDYSKYFKDLLWEHAAIGLEYNDKTNKLEALNSNNTKNAWIVNFGNYEDNNIEIIVAIAEDNKHIS